jgi:hypothetical protein
MPHSASSAVRPDHPLAGHPPDGIR